MHHMKKATFIALLLLAIGCQKEIMQTPEIPVLKDSTVLKGLLQKIEVTSSATNEVYMQYLYEYTDSGKPARITITSSFPRNGVMVTSVGVTVFKRDMQGRTTSIVYTPDTLATKTMFTYEGSTQKLKYANMYKRLGTVEVVLDSMLFEYNAQNQVSKTTQYFRQANGSYKLGAYQEYTWDTRGNLLTKQTYGDNDNNGVFEPSIKYTWEYDDHFNPRYFSDPAVFYWSYLWPTGGSVSNVKRQINDYPPNGGPDDELRYVLMYNTDRKPVQEIPFPSTNSTSSTKYTYYP